TPEENLAMIHDTVTHLREEGQSVFLDAEHFFDGYRADRDYALEVLRTAYDAGADVIALCDTNGGMLPGWVADVVHDVVETTGVRVGIHCHNDTGCAVANSLAAVDAGATHVQGTINGYGERTGNADLVTVVANLELKLGLQVLPPGHLKESVRISHAIAEIANIAPDTHQPYVGVSSFAHKAGLHASALKVNYDLYNHEDATVVGNDMRVLVTEMAGRASVELKGRELGYDLSQDPALLGRVVDRVKELEAQGWTFEAADASFELLIVDEREHGRTRPFTVESWRTIVEQRIDGEVVSEATVKLVAGDQRMVAVGEGNGPVNALDNALRSALTELYPELAQLQLVDYKVRILEGVRGTGAVTRTLVGSTDGSRRWDTVGVHENVIAASWMALEDAVAYGLLGVERD
ncbi:MAG TPA: citramalate synthase, partial [Propionibacteriaceae bacterium]|nr:citramalate synthase [Propionibacteriaceae bacterium]